MKNGYTKLSRRVWYAIGGLSNPNCWRRQTKRGWEYYY
jgi:hypothetical protein